MQLSVVRISRCNASLVCKNITKHFYCSLILIETNRYYDEIKYFSQE